MFSIRLWMFNQDLKDPGFSRFQKQREHVRHFTIIRPDTLDTFGNIELWPLVDIISDRWRVDAVRPGFCYRLHRRVQSGHWIISIHFVYDGVLSTDGVFVFAVLFLLGNKAHSILSNSVLYCS